MPAVPIDYLRELVSLLKAEGVGHIRAGDVEIWMGAAALPRDLLADAVAEQNARRAYEEGLTFAHVEGMPE